MIAYSPSINEQRIVGIRKMNTGAANTSGTTLKR